MTARAIGVVHTSMFDAWAAYDTLVDLFPARASDFALQMKDLGYVVDGSDTSTPPRSAPWWPRR